MIGIISYGSGNIRAIAGIYHRLNTPFKIVEDPTELANYDRLILPGVGAFDETMKLLRHRGWVESLQYLVLQKKIPILGVCVGMQILARTSEEGSESGLAWIDGSVQKLSIENLTSKPYLPHMGWNSLSVVNHHPILHGVDAEQGFYFLHSYRFVCDNPTHVLANSQYGEEFPCVIAKDNVFGFQFHPEKSHQNGITVFKNFSRI